MPSTGHGTGDAMETELEGDTQGPDRPLEGDRVRAVSELPGCFQPVYSQAFR